MEYTVKVRYYAHCSGDHAQQSLRQRVRAAESRCNDINSQARTYLKPAWKLGSWYSPEQVTQWSQSASYMFDRGQAHLCTHRSGRYPTANELVSCFPICFRAYGSTILLCALKTPWRSSFHFVSSSRGWSEVNGNKTLLHVLWNVF